MGEKTKAYRKGKSTTDITVDERGIIEEALEFLQLVGLVKEEEENFVNRPDVALQVIVMRLFGFKAQGYAEWKCEDMLERFVIVIIMKYQVNYPGPVTSTSNTILDIVSSFVIYF